MPRRSILNAAERKSLIALPDSRDELIRHYTFSESDLSLIKQHRGLPNRLGFAIQLCYMRYPGVILAVDEVPDPALMRLVTQQLTIDSSAWADYAIRDQTRREHLVELQSIFGFQPFTMTHYRSEVHRLNELAWQTDKGIVLATALVEGLRNRRILLPSINVIDRICAEAVTRATRRIYQTLTAPLSKAHQCRLDGLLALKKDADITTLTWLRQPPGAPNAKHVLEHIDRLKVIQDFALPDELDKSIHQNRLLKLAREGRQMTAQDLGKFELNRRYATLVALLLETQATIIDETIDVHDRIIGTLFSRAKRNHEKQFQQSSKAINEKVRLYWRIGNALLEAKQTGSDAFAAIEGVIPWDTFTQSVAEAQRLAQSEDFDYLHRIGDSYSQIRRYAPAFLDAGDKIVRLLLKTEGKHDHDDTYLAEAAYEGVRLDG